MCENQSVLDTFTQITNENEAAKPDLCIRIIKYLEPLIHVNINQTENTEEIPPELAYTLRRLLQGLGGSHIFIRKCYFATLVTLFSNYEVLSKYISLAYFKSVVEKQLSKHESKREEGEVLIGRILAYGVVLKSDIFLNSEVELQQEIILDMLSKSKEKSYLPLLSYSFLIELFNNIDEITFKRVIWPVLIHEILVDWSSQSLETLYCLLEVQKRYPSVLKVKLIISAFGTNSILHADTIEYVVKMLINVTWEQKLKHPLYDVICAYLANQTEDIQLLSIFWLNVVNTLNNSPTFLQKLTLLSIFNLLAKHSHFEKIPQLLTPLFINHVISWCGSTVNRSDKLLINSKSALQLIVSKISETSESCAVSAYKILKKLLFEFSFILVDKLTGVKIVFPCVAKLDAKHAKLLAKKCESILYLRPTSQDSIYSNRCWNFRERSYASQLLARLIGHPENRNTDWKIKHLKLLVKYSIFKTGQNDVQISNELASFKSGSLAVMKNSFFTALSHQLSHLENHRMVLISLVYYIDSILTNNTYELRIPFTNELMICWKNTMEKIQKIDLKINKTEKKKTLFCIFHTLYLQMALHLFIDRVAAKDIINELDNCYKRKNKQLKQKDEFSAIEEPSWVEITIELFLSLLSRDVFLLRQLTSRIFPHLCPYLTCQSTHLILQALLPSGDTNEQEQLDRNSIDDDYGNIQYDEIESDAEDESDSDVEESDDKTEESTVEKTRQAVRDALGIAGSVTDTESVDLDDINEEEGRKLDLALSEAFRAVRRNNSNKSKKQSVNDKALMNFKIKVLDLVDIYLENKPSVALILETIPPLFCLLEFCIKDYHQKPLEIRVRSSLKKLTNLKKYSVIQEVTEELIASMLKMLMDKGVRSTPVFLNLCGEISECCTFLLKIGVQISNKKNEMHLVKVFVSAVDNFFLKRDCLLPVYLFENVLSKTMWLKNVQLCEQILKYTFDCSVRGFRRNQGLSMLCSFYKNVRLLMLLKTSSDVDFIKLEASILEKSIQVLLMLQNGTSQNFRQSFITKLFLLLNTIKNCKYSTKNQKWNDLNSVMVLIPKKILPTRNRF